METMQLSSGADSTKLASRKEKVPMTESKIYHPNFKPFPIQATRGNIFEVMVKFITAKPADRYGWKKDHLAIFLEFNPCVGGTSGTFIELPIKEYSKDDLLKAIMDKAQETINQTLVKYDQDKIDWAAEENRQAELDSYADRACSILEAE